MSEDDDSIKKTLELLSNINGDELSADQLVKITVAIYKVILAQDRWHVGDLKSQHEYYEMLSCAENPKLMIESIGHRQIFQYWVKRSSNPFAIAYRLGEENATKALMEANIKRAAHGRRLIGSTTREKVRLEAIKHMHKSKEQAAADMVDSVNLSIGHIKRLLSALFPGDSWRTDTSTKH